MTPEASDAQEASDAPEASDAQEASDAPEASVSRGNRNRGRLPALPRLARRNSR